MPNVQKTVTKQLIDFLLTNKENTGLIGQFDILKFGEIKFEIRDGKVFRAFVSSSVLIKGEDNATK